MDEDEDLLAPLKHARSARVLAEKERHEEQLRFLYSMLEDCDHDGERDEVNALIGDELCRHEANTRKERQFFSRTIERWERFIEQEQFREEDSDDDDSDGE